MSTLSHQILMLCTTPSSSPLRVLVPSQPNAMPRRSHSEKTFKPIEIEWAISVKGGFRSKPTIVESKEIHKKHYVKVSNQNGWLCEIVAGECTRRGPLARTSLINDIKALISSAKEPILQEGVPEDDPMAKLDYDDEGENEEPSAKRHHTKEGYLRDSGETRLKNTRRDRRRSKGDTERAVTIIMPARAPQTHPDDVSKKEVTVLNTADVVWLWVNDIPWFIQYLRDQVITGGVPLMRKTYNKKEECWGVHAIWRDGALHAKAKDTWVAQRT